MATDLHANMFPRSGEASMPAAIEATDADVAGITEGTPASTPWANPGGNLQRFAAGNALGESAAAAPKRETHIERVITYLRDNGATAGGQLCVFLGVDKNAGITVHIGKALKDGRIVRGDRGLYGLPGQIKEPEEKPVGTVKASAPRTVETEVAALEKEISRHSPPVTSTDTAAQRTPDFTLTVGDAMLLSWPDGAVTVQRGVQFVELTREQSRLLSMLADLRK